MREPEHAERDRRDHEPRRPDPAPRPQHALLALQRTAGNRAVRGMIQRVRDPYFQYSTGTVEDIRISNQKEMDDAVEEVMEDHFGGVENLFLKNGVATSAASWADLIFTHLSGDGYQLAGVGRPQVLVAVKRLKDKHRRTQLLQFAKWWVYADPSEAPPWDVDELERRLQFRGAYLDEDDQEVLEAILATEGGFARTKLEVPSNSIELLDEDNVVIIIDDHQQKHQAVPVAQWEAYTGKPGSKFAHGKDLPWHTANTALVAKRLVQEARDAGHATTTTSFAIEKKAIDGIVYDLIVSYDDDTGKWVGSYHCNPLIDEFDQAL